MSNFTRIRLAQIAYKLMTDQNKLSNNLELQNIIRAINSGNDQVAIKKIEQYVKNAKAAAQK